MVNKREYNSDRRLKLTLNNILNKSNTKLIRENITPIGDGNLILVPNSFISKNNIRENITPIGDGNYKITPSLMKYP